MNIVLVWELVTIPTFLLTLWMFIEAVRDRAALIRDGRNGTSRIITESALWAEGLSLTIASLWVAAGGLAAAGSRLWVAALILSAVVFCAKVLTRRRYRTRALEYDRSAEERVSGEPI